MDPLQRCSRSQGQASPALYCFFPPGSPSVLTGETRKPLESGAEDRRRRAGVDVEPHTLNTELVFNLFLQVVFIKLSVGHFEVKVRLKLQGAGLGVAYEDLTSAAVPGPASSCKTPQMWTGSCTGFHRRTNASVFTLFSPAAWRLVLVIGWTRSLQGSLLCS